MSDLPTGTTEPAQTDRSRGVDGVAWGLIAFGLIGAAANAFTAGPTWLQLTALLSHGFLLATGAAMLARHRGTVFAITLWFVIVLICFPAFPRTLPERRELAYRVHLIAGFAGVALAVWASGILNARSPWRRWGLGVTLVALLSAPAVASVVRDWRSQAWQPPKYDESAWRFLTATTADQAETSLFPSALRASKPVTQDCTNSGCHEDDTCEIGARHRDGPSIAFALTLDDILSRKGLQATRWCDGCHSPGDAPLSLAPKNIDPINPPPPGQFSCGSCHLASEVHGGFGSAALTLGGSPDGAEAFAAEWRPRRHKTSMLRPLHQSAEFCGACHRKNWSLPQNQYRFVRGQDEFRQWSESHHTGALLAPGIASAAKSCLGCHGNDAPKRPQPALDLDAFVRGVGPSAFPPQPAESAAPSTGSRYYLDVVVHNSGIGHDFPTGMPDQREAWLEVTLRDRHGRTVLVSGAAEDRHLYRMVGLDRDGRPIEHGDMDRMVRTSEWRKIPAGGSDLARYDLTAPHNVRSIRLRLLRAVRPEFARWVGQAPAEVEVLAQKEIGLRDGSQSKGESAHPVAEEIRWRRYAEALSAVKTYPFAVQAMQRSLAIKPRDVESLIGLGRIFLAEGDVLSAQDQLRLARDAAAGDSVQTSRVAAWMAVATRTAQPARAVETLTPMVERYPQDLRLRFEVGRALMDLLRNREAAAQFKAMLDLDPLDATAHYNLMLCYQRLNLLSEARREEVVYRLLAPETDSTLGTESAHARAREAQPLHVHRLEAPR